MYTEVLGEPKPRMNQEPTEARPGHLAFFLPQLLDNTQVNSYRQEALGFAGVLRSSVTVNEAQRVSYRQGMEEALSAFEQYIQSEWKTLLLKVPSSLKDNAAYHELVREYSREGSEDNTEHHTFGIPPHRITAVKALPYQQKPGSDNYQPVLALRIIGENDRRASVYSGPGIVVELPSEGTWYHFPLSECEFIFSND